MTRPLQPPPVSGAPPRRRLVAATVVLMTFFSLMFFAVIPAFVLVSARADIQPGVTAFRVAGVCVILGSLVAVTRLVVRFVRLGRGTPSPLVPPLHLVDTGGYQRLRNPMYLAYVGVILGEALLISSWLLAWYAAVFLAIAHGYVVWIEEPRLHDRFGPAYEDYAARVPRWLPRLRRPQPRAANEQPRRGPN